MTGRDLLARAAMIAVMALCVTTLMRLFDEPADAEQHAAPEEKPTPAEIMAASWGGAISYAPAYVALNPYQSISAEITQTLFDPSDDYWGLPRSPGHEWTSAYCVACHSLQIVMQQRQTREGWDYLLTWMVEKQGMAPLPDDTRAEVLDYLVREFPASDG